VVSYPDRGPWGNNSYRGNCSGHLVKELILRFKAQCVFDPAEGGKTVRDVVDGINRFLKKSIYYEGRDLRDGWDVLSGRLPDRQFDLVWYHPPYWDIIRYSDDTRDLSNSPTLQDFEERLNTSVERLFQAVRPGGILAVLIGDKRRDGKYCVLMRTLLSNRNIGELIAVIIKVQHNCQSTYSKTYGTANPFFIPIMHEYCLVLWSFILSLISGQVHLFLLHCDNFGCFSRVSFRTAFSFPPVPRRKALKGATVGADC
jgi:hypothetical protein